MNLVDPWGLEFSDILPGIRTAIVKGTKAGAHATAQAANATADIAMNGHPLAKTALVIAGLNTAGPLSGAAGITVAPSAVSAAYAAAPHSQIIVDAAYGFFTQGPFPQSWAGLGGVDCKAIIR